MPSPIDKQTGLPIIGGVDPALRYSDERVAATLAEKQSLAKDDHDWIVLIGYSLTGVDAERAVIAKITGIHADPPIIIRAETMRDDVGPLCARCNQMYEIVQAMPCPGMSFDDYLAGLPEGVREKVIERLKAGDQFNVEDVVDPTAITVAADDAKPTAIGLDLSAPSGEDAVG